MKCIFKTYWYNDINIIILIDTFIYVLIHCYVEIQHITVKCTGTIVVNIICSIKEDYIV